MLLIMVYLHLLLGSSGENIDLDLNVDRENWLDPNDPFASSSLCTKNTLDQLAICEANLKECLKGSEVCKLYHYLVSNGREGFTTFHAFFSSRKNKGIGFN